MVMFSVEPYSVLVYGDIIRNKYFVGIVDCSEIDRIIQACLILS